MKKNLPLVSMAALVLLPVFLLMQTGCSSKPTTSETAPPSEGMQAPQPSDGYTSEIERFSDGEAAYAGFYNNFQYKATLQNSSIRSALLVKQNEYYQWEREKFLSEREKSEKEMLSETTAFLSFFTPDRHNDNLVDSKSIWRVYLDAGGRRYQGKIKKLRSLLAELQTLYPYHTRWNTPYIVTFPVPTTAIETQPSTITVTGPLGTKVVRFSSIR